MQPTQFYDCMAGDAMRLRSGTRLNCFRNTTFFQETQLFGSMSSVMDMVAERCHDVNADYATWTLFFHEYPHEFRFYTKYSHGKQLGLLCARQVAFANFVHTWRHVINRVCPADLKEVIMGKLYQVMQSLWSRLRWSDFPLCGCADYDQKRNEDRDMMCFHSLGPGVWHNFEWVATPDVSPELFLELAKLKAASWRHDLNELVNLCNDTLAYFERVPHKMYQTMYFKLASVLPRECANHVMSFLS